MQYSYGNRVRVWQQCSLALFRHERLDHWSSRSGAHVLKSGTHPEAGSRFGMASRKFYWPNWSHMFDYCLTNLQTEKQVQAVYDQADAVSGRSGVYPWPPGGSGCAITVTKTPRQGAYDNLHIHGDVGADPLDTAGGAKVFAPACAEACLHVHWRWGPNVDLLGLREYAGWSPRPSDKSVLRRARQALIPPNQGLRMRLPATRLRSTLR